MYVCIHIMLYNEFKKAGTANRVPFLNTETTEEEETAFSREQFLPPEPGHCITATLITTISGLTLHGEITTIKHFQSNSYVSFIALIKMEAT